MVRKVEENFEKTRNAKNIDNPNKDNLRGETNGRCFDRVQSKSKKRNQNYINLYHVSVIIFEYITIEKTYSRPL